jgi:hypothetical protein
MSLEEWKILAETIQALMTSLGLLAAGLWSYLLFVKRRQRFPRAELRHEVALISLSRTHHILHIKATLRNIGDVLVQVVAARAHVGRVLPLSAEAMSKLGQGCDLVLVGESDIRWTTMGLRECSWSDQPCEIEPGESDDFHFDVPVDAMDGVVEIYSYFQNEVKRGRKIGWRHASFVRLDQLRQVGDNEKESQMPNEKGSDPKSTSHNSTRQGPPKYVPLQGQDKYSPNRPAGTKDTKVTK